MVTFRTIRRAVAPAAVALLLAGCTSSSGAPASPASSPVPQALAYSLCMRAHGVPTFPLPDAQGHIVLSPDSGIDISSHPFTAAEQACRSLAPATHGSPVAPPTNWAAFGDWLQQQSAAGHFAGVVLAAQGGRTRLEHAYGRADRATDVANTPQTRFCIASMGKMFTAVAVAQLVEQGKLSFTDPIGRYVSGFPAAVADTVTIADLLTHTSGLGDAALGRPDPPTTLAGLLALIVKEPLRSVPGRVFSYSNDGFIVLGAVIERVTGESYDAYLHRAIFGPAGMSDTDVRAYTPATVAGMAHGYAGAPPTDDSAAIQVGNPSGGAISTAGDMLRFAAALTGHRLLDAAMTDTVLAGKVDANRPGGPAVDRYGYGFADYEINGVRIVGHNGGTPGYEGQLDIYPSTGIVVIMLTNQDNVLMPAIQRSEAMLTTS